MAEFYLFSFFDNPFDNFPVESAPREGYNPAVPESRQVVIYSRKGCHLCELVKESLTKLSRRGGFTWQEVDVDSDTELRRQFNDEVPVVFIDGRKAFKYRMDEREFLRKLAS
jgi:glutaredoxin